MALLFLLCLARPLAAQEVLFYATVDKNPVAAGDVFTYRITFENAKGQIEPPDLGEFDVVFGPAQATSFNWVNGVQSSTLALSYTLRCRAEGRYIIGPAKGVAGGKTYTTKPIEVEVIKGTSVQGGGARQQGATPGGQQQQARQGTDDGVRLQIQVSKTNTYVGEPISVQYVLLSRYMSLDLGDTEFPSINGFWIEEIKIGQVNWEPQYEYVNGVPYRKAILRKYLLFPQRAGEQTIDPAKITARVNRSIWSMGTEVKAVSNSPVIKVNPLPPGAPEGFNGAVGDYQFSAKAGRLEVDVNDAIDFSVVLSGKGNMGLIQVPKIAFPDDFDSYDPEVKDRLSTSLAGVSGSRTWQYVVIPRFPGDYTIPAIQFAWFNPGTGKYVQRTEGPFQIKVKGDAVAAGEGSAARARSTVRQTAEDIRFIELDAKKLAPRKRSFFGSAAYYTLTLTPFVLFAGFVVLRRRRAALLNDVVGLRKRSAGRNVKRRLAAAQKAMNEGDSRQFYAEIFTAIYGFVGDKLGMAPAQLSRAVMRDKLREAGVHPSQQEELNFLIETCEMARFSPITEQSNKAFYDRTVALIQKLDTAIK